MSGCVWIPTENGHDKASQKPQHQEALNLYVHPEPSPELDERLLRDSAAPALALPHSDRAMMHQYGRAETTADDYNVQCKPYPTDSLGRAYNDSTQTASLAPTNAGLPANTSSTVCPGSFSAQPDGMQALLEEHSKVMKTESTLSPRQSGSQVPATALPSPAARHVQGSHQQQHHLNPQHTWFSDPPAVSVHTPQGNVVAPRLPGASDPMQIDGGGFRPLATGLAGETPAPGDLYSVHSLSLSGPDRDLLDQLLGPEPGGSSPTLITPSSFLATGPFGDAGLKPALSDYSQRPTPAQLTDMLDAEADSVGDAKLGPASQPPLLNAYSEPLPFSAPLPHHLALHPACPPVAPAGMPDKDANSCPSGGAAAGVTSGQYPQEQRGPVGEGRVQHWAGVEGVARGSHEQQEQVQHHQPHHQQQQQQQQRQQQQQQQHLRSAAPYHLSRSLPTWDEDRLLNATYSAPVPGAATMPQQTGAPTSSGAASSPMHIDGQGRSVSHASLSVGGAAAISVGSALDAEQGFPGAGVCHSGGGGNAGTAAMQQSPSDSRGKRLRQPHADGRPLAAAPPGHMVPPAHAVGPAAAAAPVNRPSSPSSHSHSAGDPMSISGVEGGSMYGHGAAYPYSYGMPPPYPMSYGMPYGDPYYHPGYGYHPMMDGPAAPSGPDSMMMGYGGSHPAQSNPAAMDPSGSRMLHYPGFMAPRQRLYRRFVSGPHGRRDGLGQAPDAAQMSAPAPGQGQEGLISMASAPVGSITTSTGRPAVGRPPALSLATSTAPMSCPPARMSAATYSSGGAIEVHLAPMAPQGTEGNDRATAGATSHGQGPPPQSSLTAAPHASSEDELESAKAARACHEQFSADDMPLPLPRSTVDGIRQELRVVTQELLQRRMDEARSQQQLASAGEGGQARLQPANSWAPGDATSTMSVRSAPAAAYAMHQQQQPNAHMLPMQSAPALADGNNGPAGSAPLSLQHHGMAYISGASSAVPHKRGAAVGPAASAGTSPVRPRPAPSAPAGQVAHAPGMAASGPAAVRRTAGCPEVMAADPGSKLAHGAAAPTGAVTMRLNQPGGVAGPVGGPNAMRQLFPPPGGGSFLHGPPMCGPAASHPAPAGAGKPPLAAAASAPVGPRPAISGKSAASATQSASVAQTAPMRGAQQQPQHKGSLPVPMGSYRVGQQGSMAAEAEDDGEEVHGPPQRSSANRPVGPPAAVSSSTGGPACGPQPMAPSYYGASMAAQPYDYPPGYYYPPPMGSYGMRMYGMAPPSMPSMPPGYRGPPGGSVPMYGMPPPGMGMSGASAMPYGMGTAPWPDYSMPQMAQGGQMAPGAGSMGPGGLMRGGPAAGTCQNSEYMPSAGGRMALAQQGSGGNGMYSMADH